MWAVPGALEQVLDNLLANALASRRPAARQIELAIRQAGGWVELHVIDQGPGMTAEQRQRAFDRFWRAARPASGTGLGLAIVRRLVTADGGTIELREAAHGGLDVAITLPAAGPNSPPGMMDRTPMNALRVSLVLVLALVAAVAANLVLLGVATGPKDPVGRLSPRAEVIRLPPAATTAHTAPPPSRTTTITRTTTSPGRTTTIIRTTPPLGTPTTTSQVPTTTPPHREGGGSGRQEDD